MIYSQPYIHGQNKVEMLNNLLSYNKHLLSKMFLKDSSNAHQGYIYLITNAVKPVIPVLWNIFTILAVFYFHVF